MLRKYAFSNSENLEFREFRIQRGYYENIELKMDFDYVNFEQTEKGIPSAENRKRAWKWNRSGGTEN